MEFLTPRGPKRIDCWSVSLRQDGIGTPEPVKETRLEMKRRFLPAANGLYEQTAQLTSTQYRLRPKTTRLFAVRQRGGTERHERETGLDVNRARGLHDQRPCSGLSRHSGRERERPL